MVDILQLREKDGIETNIGEYEIIFDKPITIYPEDSISMKSCFIDTKEQDDRFEFEKDEKVTFLFDYYINNVAPDIGSFLGNEPTTGDTYVLVNLVNKGAPSTTFRRMDKLTFHRDKGDVSKKMTFSIVYKTTTNQTKTFEITLPHKGADITSGPQSHDVGVPADIIFNAVTPLQFSNQNTIYTIGTQPWNDLLLASNWLVSTANNPDIISSDVSSGWTFDQVAMPVHIIIPKGKYKPIEIVELLNTQFTLLSKSNYVINNINDIGSPSQLIKSTGWFEARGISRGRSFYLLGLTTNNLHEVSVANAPVPDIFLGTDTFSFGYDEETKLFELTQSHMPIYDDNGNKIIKTIPPNTFSNNFSKVAEAGGVFLSGITKLSFLSEFMGFNPEINVNITETKIITNDVFIDAIVPDFSTKPLIKGVNITGQYIGINSITNKNSTFYRVDNAFDFTEIVTQNNSIIAEKPFLGNIATEQGYYLVEISGFNNTNDYIGQKYSNNKIKAIVSRYYSINSYTSSGGESDVPYINISNNTQFIKSLKVRILNPDGTLASNISNDNTVFLQINRKNLLNPYVPVDSQPESNENDKKDKDNKNEK